MTIQLKEYIRERKLKMGDIAKALDIHLTRLSQICHGSGRAPTPFEIERICWFFNAEPSELFRPAEKTETVLATVKSDAVDSEVRITVIPSGYKGAAIEVLEWPDYTLQVRYQQRDDNGQDASSNC